MSRRRSRSTSRFLRRKSSPFRRPAYSAVATSARSAALSSARSLGTSCGSRNAGARLGTLRDSTSAAVFMPWTSPALRARFQAVLTIARSLFTDAGARPWCVQCCRNDSSLAVVSAATGRRTRSVLSKYRRKRSSSRPAHVLPATYSSSHQQMILPTVNDLSAGGGSRPSRWRRDLSARSAARSRACAFVRGSDRTTLRQRPPASFTRAYQRPRLWKGSAMASRIPGQIDLYRKLPTQRRWQEPDARAQPERRQLPARCPVVDGVPSEPQERGSFANGP